MTKKATLADSRLLHPTLHSRRSLIALNRMYLKCGSTENTQHTALTSMHGCFEVQAAQDAESSSSAHTQTTHETAHCFKPHRDTSSVFPAACIPLT